MSSGEFQIIQRWFSGLGGGDQVLLGVGDDAAVITLPEGHVLHTSTDTLVAGRHFPPETLPEDVAYRAVATAASDLAAMGATPLGMTLAATLPESEDLWLHGFSQGLMEAVTDFGLPLVGGDTTRGPLTVTVNVMGSSPHGHWLGRDGAQVGDHLYLSGEVGDAAMALAILEGRIEPEHLPDLDMIETVMRRFTHPPSRIALGELLREVATAAIDVSDGLLADAGHMASASGVALRIDSARLPLSGALRGFHDQALAMTWAATGGDDYELLFSLPADIPVPPGCTRIGEVMVGEGVACDLPEMGRGYDHFAH